MAAKKNIVVSTANTHSSGAQSRRAISGKKTFNIFDKVSPSPKWSTLTVNTYKASDFQKFWLPADM